MIEQHFSKACLFGLVIFDKEKKIIVKVLHVVWNDKPKSFKYLQRILK